VKKLIGAFGVFGLIAFLRQLARSVVNTAADPLMAQTTAYGRFCLRIHHTLVAIQGGISGYVLLLMGAGVYAFAFGWLSHMILHERGFGTHLNRAVGIAGALAACALYRRFGGDVSSGNVEALLVTASLGSTGALGFAALGKRFVGDAPQAWLTAKPMPSAADERLKDLMRRR
jgi:uncharacterized membrane protein YeaQ/YmgE (transglycosylase-associated protein family)